jgi:hypothetical protein
MSNPIDDNLDIKKIGNLSLEYNIINFIVFIENEIKTLK